MRKVQIPKRRGSYRTIYVPNRAERRQLRDLLPLLNRIQRDQFSAANIVHGFIPGRSPVTNALRHCGYRYTLNFDLQDFFDSCTTEMLTGKGVDRLLPAVMVEGAARQGLPTSPAMANLAARPLDRAILEWLTKNELKDVVRYTRYADDLSFSFNLRVVARLLQAAMPELVENAGFHLATHKTQLYCASNGRRMVTGVAVDTQIHPTRTAKRKLRAARHQGNVNQAQGLQAWVNQTTPD